MMRVFMAILCSLLAVCSVSARNRRHEGTDGQAAIYRLPPFERAVRCTKYFEGWHSEKHHPYVGYGHRLQPGERYSARTMTKRQADALLRKDLRKFCAMFQQFGKDSLLLATLAYNVGPYRLLGSGKSTAYHARRSSGGSSGGMQRHKGCLFPSNTPSAESGAAGRLPLPQRQVRTVPAGTTAFLLRQAAYGRFPL